jgi:hypothetical protein
LVLKFAFLKSHREISKIQENTKIKLAKGSSIVRVAQKRKVKVK